MDKTSVIAFQKKILSWYKTHQRDLPWRKTFDPYAILVSEVMLQQTQVSRVIPKYLSWLERFPTVYELAAAPISEVLLYWSGLGYNRRALNLQKTATVIVEEYKGVFPTTKQALISLPGIGEYTASAVLCFAFKQDVSVIDTNIRKVIAVEFFEGKLPDENTIAEVAQALLPHGKAYDWNQALMDYSSAVLKKEKIPLPKQSHFLSSDRFLRGQIIKVVLHKKEVTIDDLLVHFHGKKREVEREYLEKIVEILENEGFITVHGQLIKMNG